MTPKKNQFIKYNNDLKENQYKFKRKNSIIGKIKNEFHNIKKFKVINNAIHKDEQQRNSEYNSQDEIDI